MYMLANDLAMPTYGFPAIGYQRMIRSFHDRDRRLRCPVFAAISFVLMACRKLRPVEPNIPLITPVADLILRQAGVLFRRYIDEHEKPQIKVCLCHNNGRQQGQGCNNGKEHCCFKAGGLRAIRVNRQRLPLEGQS